MEDEVASFICNLVLNVVYTSLKFITLFNISENCDISSFDLPTLMASNVSQKVPVVYLQGGEHVKLGGALVQLTILIIYDRLCSLLHTTDLLKNGCLACIGSSYDKNTKMGAFVTLLEHLCLSYIYIYYVNQILVETSAFANPLYVQQQSLPSFVIALLWTGG